MLIIIYPAIVKKNKSKANFMSQNPANETSCDGWRQDWTLSSTPETLQREIISPLSVRLSGQAGLLHIHTPHLRAELSLDLTGRATCFLFSNGLRLRRETEHGTDLFSCFRPDPTTLIVETDDPRLHFASEGEVSQDADHSVITASSKTHHLVMIVNWKLKPVRMVIVSGSGQAELIQAKARAQLITSAHRRLDALIGGSSAVPATTTPGSFAPAEYLKSRLRPASLRMPAPWFAGKDEEPIWDTRIAYLFIRAFTFSQPDIAGGCIENLTSQISAEHRLPREGGYQAKLLHDETGNHLLLDCMACAQRYAGKQITEQQITLAGQTLLAPHAGTPDALRLFLRERSIELWLSIQSMAARPQDDLYHALYSENAAGVIDPGNIEPSWAALLNDRIAAKKSPDEIAQSLAALEATLADPASESFVRSWVCALLIEESVTSPIPVDLKFRWQHKLIDIAHTNWSVHTGSNTGARKINHDTPLLVLAATATWADGAKEAGRRMILQRGQRILWRINRKQKTLALTGLLIAVVFIGWLASVQLRTTMPTSVFRTRIGMVEQHYLSGEYEIALEKLGELERRRSLDPHIILFVRGKIEFKLNQYNDATASFREALELKPDHVATRFNLGVSLFRARQFDEAIGLFNDLSDRFSATHPATAARARRAAELAKTVAAQGA